MKSVRFLRILCTAVLAVSANDARAASDVSEFAKGNAEFAANHFREAIDHYQAAAGARAWSAPLFYDLGNAFFKAGDFGRAILNYERALAIEPHHPETEANLRIARDEARALELKGSPSESYAAFGTVNAYLVAAAIAFWVTVFAVARLLFSRNKSGLRIALIASAGVVCAVAIYAVYLLENGPQGSALAIVTGTNIEARLATAESAGSVLALPPGSEIKVISARGDWLYAALPNNLRGWIPANAAELVRL